MAGPAIRWDPGRRPPQVGGHAGRVRAAGRGARRVTAPLQALGPQAKTGAPAGTANRNSAPPPGARPTMIVPPCASMSALAI